MVLIGNYVLKYSLYFLILIIFVLSVFCLFGFLKEERENEHNVVCVRR